MYLKTLVGDTLHKIIIFALNLLDIMIEFISHTKQSTDGRWQCWLTMRREVI